MCHVQRDAHALMTLVSTQHAPQPMPRIRALTHAPTHAPEHAPTHAPAHAPTHVPFRPHPDPRPRWMDDGGAFLEQTSGGAWKKGSPLCCSDDQVCERAWLRDCDIPAHNNIMLTLKTASPSWRQGSVFCQLTRGLKHIL
jgi:hypothetical protein